MRNSLKTTVLLPLLLLSFESIGQMQHDDNGAQLLRDCTHISGGQPIESKWQIPPAFRCLGLIEGVVAMNASLGQKQQKFCPHEDITATDAANAIVSKLRAHPNLQEWSYANSAILSLRQAYPCKR